MILGLRGSVEADRSLRSFSITMKLNWEHLKIWVGSISLSNYFVIISILFFLLTCFCNQVLGECRKDVELGTMPTSHFNTPWNLITKVVFFYLFKHTQTSIEKKKSHWQKKKPNYQLKSGMLLSRGINNKSILLSVRRVHTQLSREIHKYGIRAEAPVFFIKQKAEWV